MRRLPDWSRALATWWNTYGWFLWSAAVVFVAVLGYIGFERHFEGGQDRSVSDLIYLSLQLFVLESGDIGDPVPWQLAVARVAAPALAAIGLVGAVTAILRALHEQEWRLRWIKDQTIVCGLGERGSALTKALCAEKPPVVVIENGRHPLDLEVCRSEGALIVRGDATDRAVLRRVGLPRARHLVALCGDDGVNAEVALNARQVLAEEHDGSAEIHLQVTDPEFRELLEASQQGNTSAGPRLRTFNVFDRAADLMLDKGDFPYRQRADEALLVVGLGSLGQSVLMTAFRRWHEARPDDELRIRALDRDGTLRVEQLKTHDSALEHHCRIDSWDEDLASPEFDRGAYHQDLPSLGGVYVCVNDNRLALTTARTLHHYDPGAGIVVRVSNQNQGLATLFKDLPGVIAVLGLDEACTPQLLLA
jgi:TrkA-N domain